MKDRSEQLHPVHESRTWPAEVRGSVHADDPGTADRTKRFGLTRGARRVPSAWHRDDDLRASGEHVVPEDLARALAGATEHVLAACDPHLLRNPVTGVEQRVEPLEAGDPWPRKSSDRMGHDRQAIAKILHHARSRVIPAERRRDVAQILEHALDGRCVERHDQRIALEVRREALQRDRADRAERLTEDHVRARLAKGIAVEMESALATGSRFAHVSVDLS